MTTEQRVEQLAQEHFATAKQVLGLVSDVRMLQQSVEELNGEWVTLKQKISDLTRGLDAVTERVYKLEHPADVKEPPPSESWFTQILKKL